MPFIMSNGVALGILQLVALTLPVIVIISQLILSSTDLSERDKYEISIWIGFSGISLIIAAAVSATYLYNSVNNFNLQISLTMVSIGLVGIIMLFWIFITHTKEEMEEESPLTVIEEEGNIFWDVVEIMEKSDVDSISELETDEHSFEEWPDLSVEELRDLAKDTDEAVKTRNMGFVEYIFYKSSKMIKNPAKAIWNNPLPIIAFIVGGLLGIFDLTFSILTPIGVVIFVLIFTVLAYLLSWVKN